MNLEQRKLKIRYTDTSLIRRLGNKVLEVSDEMGADLMEKGLAVAVSSFDTLRLTISSEKVKLGKHWNDLLVGHELVFTL